MRLTINDPNNDQYVVLLNNRPIRVVAADDEEGWVDIVDIAAVATPVWDLDDDEMDQPNEETDTAEWEEVPLKRLHGKVEIRKI